MKLFLIHKGELEEINRPIFSTGDVYILDEDRTIYVWIGEKCSVDEKASGAALARELDKERGGAAKIITVDQGEEPKSFIETVDELGTMKIVKKNIAKTMLKDVTTGDWSGFDDWKNVLYRVSSEEFKDINTMKLIQVPFSKDSLDSEDCYIADLGNKVYIWQGKSCNVQEKVKAGQWARKIDADRPGLQNEEIFEEGDDEKFIAALKRGVDYKESDAPQLRAESELEAMTEEEIADTTIPEEGKSEIEKPAGGEVMEKEEKEEVQKPEAEEVKAEEEEEGEVWGKDEEEITTPSPDASTSSSAAPGRPGQESDDILTIEKSEGRRVCPRCDESSKDMIHESVDKGNIILDYPRMYGKKYRCGSCGCVWREK
ncbi:MAG: hypothetical protein R6U96_16130 [Promethearchaeia archaeon]